MFENHVYSKVVNYVSIDILFFQLEWNISVLNVSVSIVSACRFRVVLFIYIYIYIYIQQT